MALVNRIIIKEPKGDFLFGFRADGSDRSTSREYTKDGNGADLVVNQLYEIFCWDPTNLGAPVDQQVIQFRPDRKGDYYFGGNQNVTIQTLTIEYEQNPAGGPAYEFGFNEDGSDRSLSRLRSGDGQGKPLKSGKEYTIYVFLAGSNEVFDHETFIFNPDQNGNGVITSLDFSGHEVTAEKIVVIDPDYLYQIDTLLGWQENGRLGRIPVDNLYRLGINSRKVTYTQGNPGQYPYRRIVTLPTDSLAAFDGVIIRVYGGGWGAEQKAQITMAAGNRGGFSASHQVQGNSAFISLVAHKMPNGETTIYLQFLSAFGSAVVSVDGIGVFPDLGLTGLAELPTGGSIVYNTAVNAALLQLATSGNKMAVKLDVSDAVTATNIHAKSPTVATQVFYPVQWNPNTGEYERLTWAQVASALEDPGSVDPGTVGSVDPGSVGSVDPEYSPCTPFADMCSGNNFEQRQKTITVPAAGWYSLEIAYRAHEKAVSGFVYVNDVATPVQFAQVSQFTKKVIGKYQLNQGTNTIAIASGSNGGLLCFNQICVTETTDPGTVSSGSVSSAELNGVLVIDLFHGVTNNYDIETRLTLVAPGWPEDGQNCSVGETDRYIETGSSLQTSLVVAGYARCESSQNTQIGFDRYAASLKRRRELGRTGTAKLLIESRVVSGSGQGVIISHNLKKNGQLTSISRANGVDFLITGTDNGGSSSGVYALNSSWKSLAYLVINLDADTVSRENYTGGSVSSGSVSSGSVSSGSVSGGSVSPGNDVDITLPATDFEETPVTTSARVHLDNTVRLAPRQQGNHYAFVSQKAKFIVNLNRLPRTSAVGRFVKVYDLSVQRPFADFDPRRFGMTHIHAKPALRNEGYYTAANLPGNNRAAFYTDGWLYDAAGIFADQLSATVGEGDDRVIRLRALQHQHRMIIHQPTIDYFGEKIWNDILTQAGQGDGCAYWCLDIETDYQPSLESHQAGNDNYEIVDSLKMQGMLYKRVGQLSQAAGKLCRPFCYGVEMVVQDWDTDTIKLANYFTSSNPSDPYGASTHPIIEALRTYGGYIGNDKYPRETWPEDASWYDKDGNGNYVMVNGFRRTRTTDFSGQLYGQTYQFSGIDTTSDPGYSSYNQKEADYVLKFPYEDMRIIMGYMKAFNNNQVPRRYSNRIPTFQNAQMCRWMREASEDVYSPGRRFGNRPLNPDQIMLIKLYRATFVGEWFWSSDGAHDPGQPAGGAGISAKGPIEIILQAEQRASNLLNTFWAEHPDYYYIFPLECKTGFKTANPNLGYAQQNPFMWGLCDGRTILFGACFLAQDPNEVREGKLYYNDGTRQSPAYKFKMVGRQTFFECFELPVTITNADPRYIYIEWSDLSNTTRKTTGDWHYPLVGTAPATPDLINGTGYDSGASVGGGSVSGGSVSGGSVSGGSVSGGSVSGGSVSPVDGEVTVGYITNHFVPGNPSEFNTFLDMVDEGLDLGLNVVRVTVRLGEWIKANGNTAKWDAQANLAKKNSRNHQIFLQIDVGFQDDEFTSWINANHCQRYMDGTQPHIKHPSLTWWNGWATGNGYDQNNPAWYIEPILRQIVNHFGATEVSVSFAETVEFAFSHKMGGPRGFNDLCGYETAMQLDFKAFTDGQYNSIPVQPTWNQPVGSDIYYTYSNDGPGLAAVQHRDKLLGQVKNWLLYCLNGTGAKGMMDVGGWLGIQQLLVGTTNIPLLTGGMKSVKGNSMARDDWRIMLDWMAQTGLLVDQELDFSLFNYLLNFWMTGYGSMEAVPRIVEADSLVGAFTNMVRHLLRGGRGISFFGAGIPHRNEQNAAIMAVAEYLGKPIVTRSASGLVTGIRRNLRKNEGGMFAESAWVNAGGYDHCVNMNFQNE